MNINIGALGSVVSEGTVALYILIYRYVGWYTIYQMIHLIRGI